MVLKSIFNKIMDKGMMKGNMIMQLGCILFVCYQPAYADLAIEGGINGNVGSGNTSIDVGNNGSINGNNGTGVNIGGQNDGVQKQDPPVSQRQKDIYASICSSPFMKKYASYCQ